MSCTDTDFEAPAAASHTPGPWIIKEYNNGATGEYGLHGIFREKEDKGHAQHTPIIEKVWGRTLEESDANARLIAAAPDLLAALNNLVYSAWKYDADAEEENGNWSISHEAMAEVEAAIAKAEGRG